MCSRRPSVVAPSSFEYAVVRVVPHVDREEFINAGVIVFCDQHDYLTARVELDQARLLAVAPAADVELVRRHLEAIPRICQGPTEAGPLGQLTTREPCRCLAAPRSTILQISPAHTGIGEVGDELLERLLDRAVRVGASR